jgi:signal transduction histidine kinase
LVAVTYFLYERATFFKAPPLPKILQASALRNFLTKNPLAQTLPQLQQVKHLLTQDQNKLVVSGTTLARDKVQLAKDQHQLSQAVSQLARAVHQLAEAGSVEAAQRAADSHRLLIISVFALAIVTVLAVLAGWFVAGRILRPIRTITRTAQRISSSNLHERLALVGPEDELKKLGDTLDDLFGRLDASFEAQRHFVANASHELRTPLTVERTLLQVALDNPDTTIAGWRSTAAEVLAYSDEQTRLIDALLTLANSERGVDGCESLDLAAIVAATLINVRSEADRLGIHIDEVLSPAPLEGDPLLVERLVVNLLNNAVRHNVVDGRVEVVTGAKEGKAELSVTNTGPIIPPAEVNRLFQPFQRLNPHRVHYPDGHGLGLSIVRAIATAHDASISAHPVPDGGLSVNITFPQSMNPQRVIVRSSQSNGRAAEIATT